MLQYGKLSNKNEIYLLRSAVRFGHFQLFSGQFDGLNQSVTLSELEKANKIFQPNLGSGQTSQSDLDFNRGKKPVIKSLSNDDG
jgi:hypothetical protein